MLTLLVSLVTRRLTQNLQRQVHCMCAKTSTTTIDSFMVVLTLAALLTVNVEELRVERLPE